MRASSRSRHYDVLHLRPHVLRLIPVRSAVLVRNTVDDDARATRWQGGDRRADHDRGGHANRYANRHGVHIPAIVVVVVVVMVMVIIIVMAVVVMAVVVVTVVVVAVVMVAVVVMAVVMVVAATVMG
jgi:uncharacterized membrane protein